MARPEHTFRLKQDGLIVAEVFGGDRQQCFADILHYAMVYWQDGPCTIEGVNQEDWDAVFASHERDKP